MPSSVVFCTTCKGRLQHVERTLPKNLADNPQAKFVLLDYNSQDHLLRHVMSTYAREIESGRLTVYSFTASGPFRMAHAKNMAHRLGIIEGGGLWPDPILCNLDADNFTGPGFADYIEQRFESNEDIFLWANRNQAEPVRYPKGCNGRIVIPASAFLKAGGYDESKYNAWGPDDKDFNFRLRRLGYLGSEIARPYLDVILHTDTMRFREYRHVEDDMQYETFQIVDETVTVANYGNFGCGTVFRNCDFHNPIELKPLPTRIFGIGLHKTATTSLHKALRILGYESAHWKSAHWAKRIWREMNNEGRSATVEQSYALSDLPIPMLYQALDKAYPGSKFILTMRSEESWLKSVRNHFSERNPFRAQWDEDPFTHRVHRMIYGRKDFDAEVFLERFQRHNLEVREYFKDRPGDLLVMNMETVSGWTELCGFFGHSIPSVPYPVAFRTMLEE